MAVTEIVQFSAAPLSEGREGHIAVHDQIQRAIKSLKEENGPQSFVVGTQIQEKGAIQVTSEWDSVPDFEDFKTTPEFRSFIRNLRDSCGEPRGIFHATLERSIFGQDGPATANVVEFVQSFFPVSRVTPEFRKQIENDFFKFDEIFSKNADGDKGWTYGWSLEELEHEQIEGEKATCFFIVRGWESFGHFERSIKHDTYKDAIPILFAWKAPFKMWHVERKSLE